jgi:hypothetical protein
LNKSKAFAIIFTVLLLFTFNPFFTLIEPVKATDTDYYVKNGGNDGLSGLDDTNAWATIAKVVSEFGSAITASDDVYFNRGDYFDDAQLNLGDVDTPSGTSSDWVTFGAYGTGAKPILNFTGTSEAIIYIDQSPSLGYIVIEDIHFTTNDYHCILSKETGGYFNNLTIRRCDFDNLNGAFGIFLRCGEYYKIENCTFDIDSSASHGIALSGSTSYQIRDGIIRNCTITDCKDGIHLHFLSTLDKSLGPNHWIENCTISNWASSESGIDIYLGDNGENVLIQNCDISNGPNNGAIWLGQGSRNIVLDDVYIHDTNHNAIGITESNNTIIRNCIVYDWDYNDQGFLTQNDVYWLNNTCMYQNTFISNQTNVATESIIHFKDELADGFYCKNNIFYSTAVDEPDNFVLLEGGTFESINCNWSHNLWWRGDNGAGDETWWTDSGGSDTLAQWNAETFVDGDIRANASFYDVKNEGYNLTVGSPCIDNGTWLTLCNGGGTGTVITVDEANYFFGGISSLGVQGDDITIGTEDVTITAVDYGSEVITIDREISWNDGYFVSLRYNGSAPDIGAIESANASWSNTCPVSSSESPVNQSTGVSANIGYWNVSINDADGNTTTGNITCSNGNWSNWSDQGSGIQSCNLSTLSAITNYTVWLNFSDAYGCSVNETYWFITEPENLSSPSDLVIGSPTINSISLEWTKGYLDCTHIHDLLYVDNFTKYGGNPIFTKSGTGSWASTGIRENALLTNSTGHAVKVDGKYVMYFNGRTTSPVRTTRIGRANSTDGENWDVANNYVFNDTGGYNYTFIGSVIQRGENDYIMYYGSRNDTGEGVIKYATSTDSITWTAQNTILNETNFTNAISVNIPNVVYFDSEWHMVLECDTSGGNGFKIFYANSSDGENWSAKADAIYSNGESGDWDSEDSANPALYKLDTGKYVIFYNGNSQLSGYIFDLGVLYSTSITSGWASWKNNPILEVGSGGEWDDIRLEGPRILMDDIDNATLRLWYFGLPTGNSFSNGAIGYAVCNETFIYTTVRYSTSDNLTNRSSGSLGYNGTDSYTTVTGLDSDTKYYFRAWNWNETYGWNATGSNTVNLTTSANTPPTQAGENPGNGSSGISVTPSLHVICLDSDTDVMNATWWSNSSGSWIQFASNSSIGNNTNITQTNSNFSEYFTTYYWSLNLSDGNGGFCNNTYHFITIANSDPVNSAPSPADGATDIDITITLQITVSDADGHTMNQTFRTNASGTWIDIAWNSNTGNASLSNSTSVTSYSTKYWWSSNVSDGYGGWDNDTYSFTTGDGES